MSWIKLNERDITRAISEFLYTRGAACSTTGDFHDRVSFDVEDNGETVAFIQEVEFRIPLSDIGQ